MSLPYELSSRGDDVLWEWTASHDIDDLEVGLMWAFLPVLCSWPDREWSRCIETDRGALIFTRKVPNADVEVWYTFAEIEGAQGVVEILKIKSLPAHL